MIEQNPYGIAALWLQSDGIIKTVALLLLLMSVASWLVIALRGYRLWHVRQQAKAASQFWHAQSIHDGVALLQATAQQAPHPRDPFHYLVQQGLQAAEHHQSHQQDLHGHLPLADWLTSSLKGAIDECNEQQQRGLSVLASTGSVAPFIGLFGTVWGIYHALVGIGASGKADISKIAGPVGEALIMTAFGLAVAIPAVLAYNALARANKANSARYNRFAFQLHAYLLTGAAPASRQQPRSNIQGAA